MFYFISHVPHLWALSHWYISELHYLLTMMQKVLIFASDGYNTHMWYEYSWSAVAQYGRFQWSIEKDEYLIQTRSVGFVDMIHAIADGWLLSTELHSPIKYPHQKSLIVAHQWFIYSVPFVTTESGYIFLKTLYPSSKYKKKFWYN